jgi:hypothetical protein
MGVLYPKAGWLSRNFFGVAQKFFLTFYIKFSIIHLKESRNLLGICKKVLDCMLVYAYNSYSEMEKAIHKTEKSMLELAVFMFCVIGCGMTSYHLGKQEGIETTIEHLVDHGMLELDEE